MSFVGEGRLNEMTRKGPGGPCGQGEPFRPRLWENGRMGTLGAQVIAPTDWHRAAEWLTLSHGCLLCTLFAFSRLLRTGSPLPAQDPVCGQPQASEGTLFW